MDRHLFEKKAEKWDAEIESIDAFKLSGYVAALKRSKSRSVSYYSYLKSTVQLVRDTLNHEYFWEHKQSIAMLLSLTASVFIFGLMCFITLAKPQLPANTIDDARLILLCLAIGYVLTALEAVRIALVLRHSTRRVNALSSALWALENELRDAAVASAPESIRGQLVDLDSQWPAAS